MAPAPSTRTNNAITIRDRLHTEFHAGGSPNGGPDSHHARGLIRPTPAHSRTAIPGRSGNTGSGREIPGVPASQAAERGHDERVGEDGVLGTDVLHRGCVLDSEHRAAEAVVEG